MTHTKLLDIDPVARALIQHKVRRLVGRSGYGISDQEDLEQDLALHAHRVARHFNPDRGTAVAFYEQVLSRKVKNLASRQFAKKRDWRRVISVNTHALNELAIAIDPIASMDRRLDLGEVISALPPELWRLALQLKSDPTLWTAARALGLTRSQARTRRRALAKRLSALGLGFEGKKSSRSLAIPRGVPVVTHRRSAPMTTVDRSCAHAA